ncbi:hypothetical protein QTP88_022105 [Uroleucon formosanum]
MKWYLFNISYLKDRGLLLADNPMTCIKVKDGVVCNGQLVEYLRSSKKRNSDGTMKKVIMHILFMVLFP